MSIAYYIVLDKNDQNVNTYVHSEEIARAADTLDAIATRLSMPTLDDFVSMSREELDDMLQAEDEIPVMEPNWFSPAQGIVFFERLAKHLQANPNILDNANVVLHDLAAYQHVLRKALKIDARWHLGLDF